MATFNTMDVDSVVSVDSNDANQNRKKRRFEDGQNDNQALIKKPKNNKEDLQMEIDEVDDSKDEIYK